MRLLILLFLVSCASFENETIKNQNDKATDYNCPACDRTK